MSSTVQVLEGQGINRKLLLIPMRLQSHKPMLSPSDTLSVGPQPSLEFGCLCVKNALFLLTNSNVSLLYSPSLLLQWFQLLIPNSIP